MHWHRNSGMARFTPGALRIVVAALISCLFFVEPAMPDDVGPKGINLIREYVRIAFGPDRPLLKKFDAQMPIAAAIRCVAGDAIACGWAKDAVEVSIHGTKNLKLDFNSSTPQIEFVFADRPQLNQLVQQARQDFQGGFSDVSDSDCVVFSQSAGSQIQKARLMFSVEQPPLKLKLCVAVQFFQALGLNAFGGVPFAQQWANPVSGVGQTSESQFDFAIKQSSLFEFIHMCPELHSGMTSEQVIEDLSREGSCIKEIVPNLK